MSGVRTQSVHCLRARIMQGDAGATTTVAFREQSASPSALLHNPMLPGGGESGAQYQM